MTVVASTYLVSLASGEELEIARQPSGLWIVQQGGKALAPSLVWCDDRHPMPYHKAFDLIRDYARQNDERDSTHKPDTTNDKLRNTAQL